MSTLTSAELVRLASPGWLRPGPAADVNYAETLAAVCTQRHTRTHAHTRARGCTHAHTQACVTPARPKKNGRGLLLGACGCRPGRPIALGSVGTSCGTTKTKRQRWCTGVAASRWALAGPARLLNATHHDVAVDALLDQRLALDADDAVLLRVVDPVVRAAAQTKPNPPRCAAAGALNQPTDWHRCTVDAQTLSTVCRPPAGRSRVTAPAPAAAVVLLRRCAVAGAVPGHARPVRPVRIIRCSWFVLTQISSSFTSYLCSATRFLPTQPSLV